MHTKTSKQVLSPLADAVSALIVIISEAEETQSPTPDLSQLAKAVDSQIQNLIIVAKKIASQPSADISLQKEMPNACAVVGNASTKLVSSATELSTDPHSSKARLELLDSVNGILQGTTTVLDVFDESEIVKIQNVNQLLRNQLLQLQNHGLEPSEQAEFTHLLRKIAQSIFQCCQLSSTRVNDILSERLAAELQMSVSCMVKESSNFMNCCKMIAMHLNSKEAKESLIATSNTISNETLRIDAIVACKDAELFFQNKQVPHVRTRYSFLKKELLSDAISNRWKSSASETRIIVQDFIAESKSKAEKANDLLHMYSNNQVKEFSSKAENCLRDYYGQFQELLDNAFLELNESEFNNHTMKLLDGVDACISALEYNRNRGLISGLITATGDLSDPSMLESSVGRLNDGINKNDAKLIESSIKRFKDQSELLYNLVNNAIQQMDAGTQLYGVLQSANERANAIVPQITSSAALFQKYTTDYQVGDHLQNVILGYTDIVRTIQKNIVSHDSIFTTPDLLDSSYSTVMHSSKNFLKLLSKNTADDAKKELCYLTAATNQLIVIAEKEKENTEDTSYIQGIEYELQYLRSGRTTIYVSCTKYTFKGK